MRPAGAICLTAPNADYILSKLPTFADDPQVAIDAVETNSLDGDAHRFLYTREVIALARGVGLKVAGHGYFLPAWQEGHARKTRYLHQLMYGLRHGIARLPSTVPWQPLARRCCSSQWLIATRA